MATAITACIPPQDKLPPLLNILAILDEHCIPIEHLPVWLSIASVIRNHDDVRSSLSSISSYASTRSSILTSTDSIMSAITQDSDMPSKPLPPIPSLPPSSSPRSRPVILDANTDAHQWLPASLQSGPQYSPALAETTRPQKRTQSPSTKGRRRDNRSFCHNCDGISCGKYGDMRVHWSDVCESKSWFRCLQCDLLCTKKSDMTRHLRWRPLECQSYAEISVPSKVAFGCPHCGNFFDHDNPPQSQNPGSYQAQSSFRTKCLDHMIQHYRDGKVDAGDSTIRVRALLRQRAVQEALPLIFQKLGIEETFDLSRLRWTNVDAVEFARKLEIGILSEEERAEYGRHVIQGLDSFVASMVERSINKADFRVDPQVNATMHEASVTTGPMRTVTPLRDDTPLRTATALAPDTFPPGSTPEPAIRTRPSNHVDGEVQGPFVGHADLAQDLFHWQSNQPCEQFSHVPYAALEYVQALDETTFNYDYSHNVGGNQDIRMSGVYQI